MNRLKKSDIDSIFKSGKFRKFGAISMHFKKNNLGYPRFGFALSKKNFKKATERNLVKRRAREIIRMHAAGSASGHDVLLVFGSEIKNLTFSALKEQLIDALKSARIL
ncbi:ribonuclease P protein component [Candidatus Giovannonibacteria bacterium]|nr:ribonuclease P protein component [Candidatus Giovannonibacteria bacterium]